jgi:hypothetical protein
VLPGLCFVNELISHDEALHCDFAGVLYSCLLKPPCSIHVREIIDSAIHVGSMRSEESGEKTRQSWGWGNISENEQCGGGLANWVLACWAMTKLIWCWDVEAMVSFCAVVIFETNRLPQRLLQLTIHAFIVLFQEWEQWCLTSGAITGCHDWLRPSLEADTNFLIVVEKYYHD